jgi:hypothetical protein
MVLHAKAGHFRIITAVARLWSGTPTFFGILTARTGKTLAIVLALLRKLSSSKAMKIICVMGHT